MKWMLDCCSSLVSFSQYLIFVSGDRFAEASMDGKGYDRVRRTEIGRKNFKLTHFEEVCRLCPPILTMV